MARPRTHFYPHRAAFAPDEILIYTAEGVLPLPEDSDLVLWLMHADAGAYTLAAPTAKHVGRKVTILGGTDFAHVVTSAAANIWDGTAGGNTTLTFAAVAGSAVRLRCVAANTWIAEFIQAVTPAA
jgi:hypothetical protein